MRNSFTQRVGVDTNQVHVPEPMDNVTDLPELSDNQFTLTDEDPKKESTLLGGRIRRWPHHTSIVPKHRDPNVKQPSHMTQSRHATGQYK